MVSQLILGVVVNILRHIGIKVVQRSDIGLASSSYSRHFTVLGSAEFVVLYPQIGFEDFRRSQESQNRGVSRGNRGLAKDG